MALIAPVSTRRELRTQLRSVVKVMCVSDAPNYDQPWQTHGPSSHFGSGAIIDTASGPRVLTNAHCVSDHAFVEVRRYGNAQKFVASVQAIGHDCDLALLSVEDEEFFHATTAIPIGILPRLSSRVLVCGYPVGGERLSITEGIVSRIELVSYSQSNRRLLAVQIDAAINSGNSGGPVIMDGRLVGVAFQALDDAEQIGYMIAPSVVEHFLSDVAGGSYDGFPSLGVSTQTLEAKGHRRYLDLPSQRRGGVLVTQVAHGGSAAGVLEQGDLLLAIDGVPVAADGTVVIREGELIDYSYAVERRHVGERMPVSVWRKGQQVTCVLDLRPPRLLVPEERFDQRPSYYIVGGLLFAPLTRDYLGTWGDSWWHTAPRELMVYYESGMRTEERDEIVLLQKVLADRLNQGYHDLDSVRIESFGGVRVRSVRHLVQLVENCTDEFLRFDAADGRRIVLDREKSRKRSATILQKFGVPHPRSEDLR